MQINAVTEAVEVKELKCMPLMNPSDEEINDVFVLESLFPEKIKEGIEQVSRDLRSPENINFVMRAGDKIVGHIILIPHNEAYRAVAPYDPQMKEEKDRFYVDKINLNPEYRQGLKFMDLVFHSFVEANRRGVKKFSSHILAEHKLNKVIAATMKDYITEKRIVNLSCYDNLPFEYMEATCTFV
jgi:hypothetical protein